MLLLSTAAAFFLRYSSHRIWTAIRLLSDIACFFSSVSGGRSRASQASTADGRIRYRRADALGGEALPSLQARRIVRLADPRPGCRFGNRQEVVRWRTRRGGFRATLAGMVYLVEVNPRWARCVSRGDCVCDAGRLRIRR